MMSIKHKFIKVRWKLLDFDLTFKKLKENQSVKWKMMSLMKFLSQYES